MPAIKPCLLTILDGWGHRSEPHANAIAQAYTPHWQTWCQQYPYAQLHCSGSSVGLPEQQMGNSEVGHLHLSAGRIVNQTLTQIDEAINQPDFYQHTVFKQYLTGGPVHILGLLSPGGVHSHERHMHTLLKVLKHYHIEHVFLHLFLDGRDTPPQSAATSLQTLIAHMNHLKIGTIASLCGRYYAMDRDKRWDRTQQAYQLLTTGQGLSVTDPLSALDAAYQQKEYDEFIRPCRCAGFKPIDEQSTVFFMNFRADRARQLAQALIDSDFKALPRTQPPPRALIGLTPYNNVPLTDVLFPKIPLTDTLGHVVAEAGLQQFRIAETEKYAHVTYFFNGGQESPLPGETRQLIPSPTVSTYDQAPEMSAQAITEQLINAMQTHAYALYVCNYANPDMVGHTGNFPATKQAITTVDRCLGQLFKAAQTQGIQMYITADHGNAEQMYDLNCQQPHTRHTNHLVPFLSLNKHQTIRQPIGQLIDVAPTILSHMGLTIPTCMTGQILVSHS